jgi:hypothetical protein
LAVDPGKGLVRRWDVRAKREIGPATKTVKAAAVGESGGAA